MRLRPQGAAWGSGMPDLNPVTRLAAVLRATGRVTDPEQVALLAIEHLTRELYERYGYSASADWLAGEADIYRARTNEP
jgi:hypothetical protein